VAAAAVPILLPAASVSAAPANAPNRLVGTADCGSDGTFSFVVNSGNAQGTTWNPAFVTRSDGARGIFHPASFDLTFTSPRHRPGSRQTDGTRTVTCSSAARQSRSPKRR
jgi:hypothetical protein